MSNDIHHDPIADDAGVFQQARINPDNIALISPKGEEVTFFELVSNANRLSNLFRSNGVGTGDVVASLQNNSIEHFETNLATIQIGAYMVPINTHLTPREISYILENSGAKVLVASGDLADKLPDTFVLPEYAYRVGGSKDKWLDYELARDSSSPDTPQDRIAGMTMCYTSGTTGNPKGVKRPILQVSPEMVGLSAKNFLSRFDVAEQGVQILFSPVYHAAPGNFTIQALHLGHTVVIMEKFDPEKVLVNIEEYKVTNANAVPTQLQRLLRLPEEVKNKYDLSSLQNVLVAGAPFPPKLKQEMLEWWGPVIWEYLAATEGMASVVSPAEAIKRPGTVGKPQDVIILSEEGEELGHGEVGTIYFKLEGKFEYHGEAQKTAEAHYKENYATAGDMGYLDEEGYLFLMDRRVDLIITGGVNVYPIEIENRLTEHQDVADAAVIGIADEEWGQVVTAVVQLNPGVPEDENTIASLEAWCRETLTGAKIPRKWRFTDTLSRTEVGKLLRRKIREHYENINVA